MLSRGFAYYSINMTISKARFIVPFSILFMSLALGLTACSGDSKQRAEGDLKDTEYCKKYKQFDKDVATDDYEDQLKKLEATAATKDFPAELKKDYEFVIEGYEKVLDDKPVSQDEKKYEAAVKRISRHAIDHCDLLESNTKRKSSD